MPKGDPIEMSEKPMTGGRLIVESLHNLGATKCFGVPGESYLDVLDALHDTKGKFDFVLCRNEGGAAFMAEAWGKMTGKPGICLVTRGPGATNASIGVHSAMQASTPMLLLIGQVGTDLKGREAFQEIDYRAFYGPVAKWVFEIEQADRVPEIISRAWTTALSGRPGPVVVALPEDILLQISPERPCQSVRIPQPAPPADTGEEIVSLLEGAERPLIIAGGGGWSSQARENLRAFVAASGIPVLSAFRYHDVFDNDNIAYCGDAGVGMLPHVKQMIMDCDVLIALNIRFGEMTTDAYTVAKPPNFSATLIHSHASDGELGKIYGADLPIHAGPLEMAKMLAGISGKLQAKASWVSWRETGRKAFEASQEAPPQPGDMDMGKVCGWLRENLPEDCIVTNGAGNFAIWPNKFLRFSPARRLLAPQSGAMGYGLPAAVAAKIAEPEKLVLCFAGDGDLQMNCQELGTAMQADARPVILVLNNGSYGTIRMHQERHYPERVSGTELVNPDFVAIAKAYGMHAERLEKTGDFPEAFRRAAESKTGALLELMIPTEAITPRATLADIRRQALATERS